METLAGREKCSRAENAAVATQMMEEESEAARVESAGQKAYDEAKIMAQAEKDTAKVAAEAAAKTEQEAAETNEMTASCDLNIGNDRISHRAGIGAGAYDWRVGPKS